MSTIEEFKAAPVGATASDPDGRAAVKTPHKEWHWSLFDEDGERIAHGSHHHMATQGWTLDPAPTAPTSAREALDLAWELAHPVKAGQVIPGGTDAISARSEVENVYGATLIDQVADKFDELHTRTLDPLPEPAPDWLDAPAVLAAHAYRDDQVLWENCDGIFVNATLGEAEWSELRDVTPLYPKEQDA